MLYLTKAERRQMELAGGCFQSGWMSHTDRQWLAEAEAPMEWVRHCADQGRLAEQGRIRVRLGWPIGTACRWAGIDRDGKPGTGTLYALACPI